MNTPDSESSGQRAPALQAEPGAKRRLRAIGLASVLVLATVATGVILSGRSPTPALSPAPSLQSESTQPKITWSPATLNVALSPGDLGARRLTLSSIATSSEPYAIEVVPELKPFISVNPTTSVVSSTGTLVVLQFRIPSDTAPRRYDGTVQVRAGNRILSNPLKVILTIQQSTMPPDPGTAGDATVEGIDSNGDGVRDDVERYIDLTYPDSQSLRNMLRQEAIVTEAALLDGVDRQASRAHVAEAIEVQHCLRIAMGLDEARHIRDGLMLRLLNTNERTRAYLNRNLGSYVIRPPGQSGTGCNF